MKRRSFVICLCGGLTCRQFRASDVIAPGTNEMEQLRQRFDWDDPSLSAQPIPWYLMHRVREGNDPYAVDEPMPEFLMHRIVEHGLKKHNHDQAYIDMVHRAIIEIYSQPDSPSRAGSAF